MYHKTAYRQRAEQFISRCATLLPRYGFARVEKKLWLFIFALLLSAGPLLAQPGGGGGLIISGFYNTRLGRINMLTDHSLQIRTFLLAGAEIYQETFLYQTLLKQKSKTEMTLTAPGFDLPPATDIHDRRGTSDQRMYIVFEQDTMIVDFIGIPGANGAGYRDRMDSLVIQKGYFKYYRTGKEGKSPVAEDDERNRKLTGTGLTLYTAAALSSQGYIEYNPSVDLSFLADKNLPVSYFLGRAAYYLQNDQTGLAFADIEHGMGKNNGHKNCAIYYLLCDAYDKTAQYEKAIEHISMAMDCKSYIREEDWESRVINCRTRIALFIKLEQYEQALNDYNALCDISKFKTRATLERAAFKMKYLKDYKNAIHDLRAITDTIPVDHLSDRPQGWSEYSDTYFALALAEYLNGEQQSAFRHWLKAEEFGYSESGSDEAVIHFDSIINRNPEIPALYLCRALAQFRRSPYFGGGAATRKCFDHALNDISKAEASGMKDYRVNMYRASVLNQIKQYRNALKEVNRAIVKNGNDPRCFLIRYYIRNNLGQAQSGYDDDTDVKQYKILSQHWKWEQY